MLSRHGYHVTPLSSQDRRYLNSAADTTTPLPADASGYLDDSNPRLRALRDAYRRLEAPVSEHAHWTDHVVGEWVDLRYFRGETMFVWHYRDLPEITALRYFVFGEYVRARDEHSLIAKLGEDGAFGCWTFDFDDRGRYSRDLLDSVNELCFLERELQILEQPSLRVLDIGAGYGRLAYRMAQAVPGLSDYCCVDAVPESTFLCEYYLKHRGVTPPARVVSLDRVEEELEPGAFDLAVNIHSFSECGFAAIEWWVELLRRLRVPRLLIVPNDGERMLSAAENGTRRDFAPLLSDAGYRVCVKEPAFTDQAVRELLGIQDRFLLFELAGT